MKVNKHSKPTSHFAENFVYDVITANAPKEEPSDVTAVVSPADADALAQHDENVKAEEKRKKQAYSEPAMKRISAESDKRLKELQDIIKGGKTIPIPANNKTSIHKILKELESLGYTHNGKTKGYFIGESTDESIYKEIHLIDLEESASGIEPTPADEQAGTVQYCCMIAGETIPDNIFATYREAKEYAEKNPEIVRIERSKTEDGYDTETKVLWKRKVAKTAESIGRKTTHTATNSIKHAHIGHKHTHEEIIEHLHSKNRPIKESTHKYDLSDGVFSLSDSDFQELLDIVCDELPYWSGFEDEDGRELLDFFEIRRDNSYDDREPVVELLSYYVSGEPWEQHGAVAAQELLGLSDDDIEDEKTDESLTSSTRSESFDIHTYTPAIETKSLWEEIVKQNKLDELQFVLESSFNNKPTANDLSRLLSDEGYIKDILELDKKEKTTQPLPSYEESLAREIAENKIAEDYEKLMNPYEEPIEDEFNQYDPTLN